jgi:transposase
LEHKKFKLNELISSDIKSTQYFSNLRGNGKKLCPRCRCKVQYNLTSNRYWCKDCRYNFSEFTGTYLARIKIKPSGIIHLLNRFASGHSAYKIKDSVQYDISTIERIFLLFRQAIYDASLAQLQQLQQKSMFSKEIEIDKVILDCHHRREVKQIEYRWSTYKDDNLVIGVYRMNNNIAVTFPVSSNISNDILTTLRKEIDDKEWRRYLNEYSSFYKSNDCLGYGMLKLIGKRQLVTYRGIEPYGDWPNLDIEDFWGYMNEWLYHYRGVPKKYFPLYLKEIEFRFNNMYEMYEDIFFKLSQLLVNSYPTCR